MRKKILLASLVGSIFSCGAQASTPGVLDPGELAPEPGLRMAMFGVGSANAYQRANIAGAKAAAEKYRVNLTVYTGDLDVQVQKNQIDMAVQRQLYDSMITALMSGDLLCKTVKNAVASGMKVVLYVTTACGGVPDGVSSLVNLMTPELFAKYWDYIFSTNSPQDVAVLALDPSLDLEKNNKAAMQHMLTKYPGFRIASYQNTNDTVTGAYQMTQDMLRAQPQIKIIATASASITQGVVQALRNAGRTGTVKVYDLLGNKFTVEAIKRGEVTASIPGLPYTEGYLAVETAIRAQRGEALPKLIDPSQKLMIDDAPVLTKKNVHQFQPEY